MGEWKENEERRGRTFEMRRERNTIKEGKFLMIGTEITSKNKDLEEKGGRHVDDH